MMGFGLFGFELVGVLVAILIGWWPQTDRPLFKNPRTTDESPRDILDKRYASGRD